MSLGQSVKSQLLQLGNPVPPGKYVSPGGAMPAYQGLSDVPWDGAARGVANAPSPAPITKVTKIFFSPVPVFVSEPFFSTWVFRRITM